MTEDEAAELVAQLRAVLELVESGELPAEVDQVGFLRGAIATAGGLGGRRLDHPDRR